MRLSPAAALRPTVDGLARRVLLAAALALAASGGAWAQRAEVPYDVVPYALSTPSFDGRGDEPWLAFEARIEAAPAPWMRVVFAEHHLGRASYVELVSEADGGRQRLDTRSMEDWSLASAGFNGDSLQVALYVAPGDTGVSFAVRALVVGAPCTDDAPAAYESLCNTDDREATIDNRVGRLFAGGCTVWRVTNGAFLTAGHCVDFDPDLGGPALPDGQLDLGQGIFAGGIVEFEVPDSSPGGCTIVADPDDQYPIDLDSVEWSFDGEGQGLGKDWAVFAVNPNANTGLLPHQAYGLPYRMTREAPSPGATVRVTGFGVDGTPSGIPPFCPTSAYPEPNAQNFTNQTSTGTYLAESTGASPADIEHEYLVDTTGGNSGSPVLWALYDVAIGIHTNGGCDGGDNGNHGTSFEVDVLEATLADIHGMDAVFVDAGHPLVVAEDGTVFRPYDTVLEGVTTVTPGGVISIVSGDYPQATGNAVTVTTPMTLLAPAGSVTIGG